MYFTFDKESYELQGTDDECVTYTNCVFTKNVTYASQYQFYSFI